MAYQYSNSTYDKGHSQEQQEQQNPLNEVSNVVPPPTIPLYPGPEQQGPPPTIIPPEKQQSLYTDTYSQYASPPQQQNLTQLNMPEVPTSNQHNDNPNNPPPYSNNLYSPPAESPYNNNTYPSYNHNTYNPPYEPNHLYGSSDSSYNNVYNASPQPSYNAPPQPSYNGCGDAL